MGFKQLKDPIYGYVKIEEDIFKKIIDTSCFQRLRNIRQTSYAPLYSAALHNRFIHSLGVYHLGTIAFEAIKQSEPNGYTQNEFKGFCEKYEKLFTLACLLHDVGHAPFSHSGENFYLSPNPDVLYKRLTDNVNSKAFTNDANNCKPAAPHEIMSVIIALEQFPDFFENDESRDFFARCITGYLYQKDFSNENTIKNCIISLLNSSLIDVDRLDYLIRDASVIGYESVLIDYNRLLNGIMIIYNDTTQKYVLAYDKKAISIIENVIYAYDCERKWIQNHPVVQYESYLLQYAIKSVNSNFASNENSSLLCAEALTKAGQCFENIGKISLLCDDDIIYLMKNVYPTGLTDEYFSRVDRRHPIWKSESEYRALFDQNLGGRMLDRLEDAFSALEKYLSLMPDAPVINESTLQLCKDELHKAEKQELGLDKESIIKGYSSHIRIMECLKSFAIESEIDFDYVLITASKFSSGFMKDELKDIQIRFANLNKTERFEDVVTSLSSSKKRDKFFYLYCQRGDKTLDAGKFISCIGKMLFD